MPERPALPWQPDPVAVGDAHASAAMRRLRSRSKALPEQARAHNRALVLQTLYHAGSMSRADLARRTRLTRVTISDLVAESLADGIIVELGIRESAGPGKPAILVDIDRHGHQVIGIDLTDTTLLRGAVMTLDGDVLAREALARPHAQDDAATIAAVQRLAHALVSAASAPVLGVGVAVSAVVHPDVEGPGATGPGAGDSALETALGDDLSLPVIVCDGASTAALGEYTFGDARSDLAVIRIGAEVSAGIIADAQLVRGHRFAAGAIGHVVVGDGAGPRCTCGRRGCLQAWVSATRVRAAIGADPAARADILRDAGAHLGTVLSVIASALDLSEIVISAPRDLYGDVFVDEAARTLRARTLPGAFDDVQVRMTAHDDGVLSGAAVLVLSSQLGIS